MMRGLIMWLNSVQAHMLALPLITTAALTALSFSLVGIATPPQRSSISVREVSRFARGLPVARDSLRVDTEFRKRAAPQHQDPAELYIGTLLAERLGVPRTDVRVRLNSGDRARAATFAREIELYGHDGGADPLIYGSFEISIRNAAGWRVLTRRARDPVSLWHMPARTALIVGMLLMLPFTLWFSARLTRPIRSFVTSIKQLSPGHGNQSVPVTGPTELRLVAKSINDMQARIARYMRERSSLTGAIAHDLRTPLARLQFVLRGAPSDVREAANREIREMEDLIGNTLDFVDIENRELRTERIDLGSLVEGLADDFADMGHRVAIIAASELPLRVDGDMIMLKRLFGNLIDNAVKYGGAARISTSLEGSCAVIRISDQGPGMTAEERLRAFEPFFRGEPSRNRKTGGTGLGLAIVRMAVDAHRGSIELHNCDAGGLSVVVSLPVSQTR